MVLGQDNLRNNNHKSFEKTDPAYVDIAMVNDIWRQTEICVVGAGPAGLSVTRALASHRRDVLLIDSGGERLDEASQMLGIGQLSGLDYFPLHESRRRGLGGSSNHWDIPIGDGQLGARLHQLGKDDFSVRDWIPRSGWPIEPAVLDPYYRQAARLCGIAPVDTGRLMPAGREAALPLDPGVVETIVFQIGAANRWRPEHALSDVPADRLRIMTHTTATEIVLADNGAAVIGVRGVTADGRTLTVGAAVVVLAAGGIENARLLLLSGRGRRGLGNDRDQVGRCFMEHPWLVAGLFSTASGGLIDRAGLYQVHRARHGWAEARLALPEPVRRAGRLLGCGVRLRRLGRDDQSSEHVWIKNVHADVDRVGDPGSRCRFLHVPLSKAVLAEHNNAERGRVGRPGHSHRRRHTAPAVSFHQLTTVESGQHVRVAHDDRPRRWPTTEQETAAAGGTERGLLRLGFDPHAKRRPDPAGFPPRRRVRADEQRHRGHADLRKLPDEPVCDGDSH